MIQEKKCKGQGRCKGEMEIWKDIKGYEGCYQISSNGRLRSLDRYVNGISGCKRLFRGKLMNLYLDKGGYQINLLAKNGKKKNVKIHRLVANAFIPNPKHKKQVNHINEVKTDNRVKNLEWATNRENNMHNGKHLRLKKKLRNNPKTSKTVYQYDLNGNFIKKWPSTRETSRSGNFDHVGVWACANGINKTHLGYKWSYERI